MRGPNGHSNPFSLPVKRLFTIQDVSNTISSALNTRTNMTFTGRDFPDDLYCVWSNGLSSQAVFEDRLDETLASNVQNTIRKKGFF